MNTNTLATSTPQGEHVETNQPTDYLANWRPPESTHELALIDGGCPWLGIKLSSGHILRWMAASGALKFDGKGWGHEKLINWILLILSFGLYRMIDTRNIAVVAKTVTLNPIVGNYRWWNPFRCIRPIFRGWRCIGFVNKVGLTNKGLKEWVRTVGKNPRRTTPLIFSTFGSDEEILECMREADGCLNIIANEANISCPNMGKGLASNPQEIADRLIKFARASKRPFIAKLSSDMPCVEIAKILSAHKAANPDEKCVEAISINTVPWNKVFPGKRSPLHRLEQRLVREAEANGKTHAANGGGVSGIPAQAPNWKAMQELASCYENTIPVIGGSMWSYADTLQLITRGCKAISFGSIYILKPWAPSLWSKRVNRMARKYSQSDAKSNEKMVPAQN